MRMKVSAARTFNKDLIRSVFCDEEMYRRTCHDKSIDKKDFDPDVDNDDKHFVAFYNADITCVGTCLFARTGDPQVWDIHIEVLDAYRDHYAYDCGLALLRYAHDNLIFKTLLARIPSFFKDVCKFVEKFGFELDSYDEGSEYNVWTDEIGDMLYYRMSDSDVKIFLATHK